MPKISFNYFSSVFVPPAAAAHHAAASSPVPGSVACYVFHAFPNDHERALDLLKCYEVVAGSVRR